MGADGFCPKCGAIMHNGVCMSCSYSRGGFQVQQTAGQQANEQQTTQYTQQTDTGGRYSGNMGGSTAADYSVQNPQPRKSGSKTWILIAVILCLCIAVPVILIMVLFYQVKDVIGEFEEVSPEPEINWEWEYEESVPSEDYYDWDEDYTYEEYVPDASDDYLEEIVSSTVRGLSYDIAWSSHYIYPDDEDSYAGFSYYYPIVIHSEKSFIDDINAAIYEQATSYESVTLEEENFGYVDSYVTYMTEDILSVVFMYYRDEFGAEEYKISALNFDMTTGELIPVEDIMPAFEFVAEFRNTCEVQNGYYSTTQLDTMTDEEIMEAIKNPETGVAFYSPVGVDLGFNYPDGWMTVTMKFGTY